MCGNNLLTILFNRKIRIVFSVALLMVTMPLFFCGTTETEFSRSTIEHQDEDMNLYRHNLALRFAPRLYIHDEDSTEIFEIIPVFHPEEPVIAYHIFLEDDALFKGWGKEIDHEILWVEYDPVTLKVTDVATYWHRTILRTDTCIVDAKASQQRPKVFIQWGQHGLLPLGWETLKTLRPRGELWVHYILAKIFTKIPWWQKVPSPIIYQGTWEDYTLRFTKEVDATDYVRNQEIIVDEYPDNELRSRIETRFGTFGRKKEWPWWSPYY